MSPEQNKIMGYFIEESKEHLNTIGLGLVHLSSTVADANQIGEVFRAAHSIKGGSAMLGLNSIKQIAHGLEECFKILKEVPVDVDETLKSLFLEVFDCLKTLLENLSSTRKLSDEDAAQISSKAEATITELITHLERLPKKPRLVSHFYETPTKPVPASQPTLEEDSALQLIFKSDIPKLLQHMLETFKQPDGSGSRQQLGELCRNFLQAGETFELREWNELIQKVTVACQNHEKTYNALAPVIIREIKQARQLVLTGKVSEITPTQELTLLLPPVEETKENSPDFIYQNTPKLKQKQLIKMNHNSYDDSHNYLLNENLDSVENSSNNSSKKSSESIENINDNRLNNNRNKTESITRTKGPEIGAAELNTLADIFEDYEIQGWDEEIFEATQEDLNVEILSSSEFDVEEDFSDLLFDEDESNSQTSPAVNQHKNVTENTGEYLLDEISSLTADSSGSTGKTKGGETPLGEYDDSFQDLFDLDDINGESVSDSSDSPVEDLNSLFDDASDEELDLNWKNEMANMDYSSAIDDKNPIWDLEETDSKTVKNSSKNTQNKEENTSKKDLNLSVFTDFYESENDDLARNYDFEEIISNESDDVEDVVSYDDLFSIEDEQQYAVNNENQQNSQAANSATESLEDLFGDSPESGNNDFDEAGNDNFGNYKKFADIFGEDESELESLEEPEEASAEEDLGEWLNLDGVETAKPKIQDVDFYGLDDLFNDDNDQVDSSDEMLSFEDMTEETTEEMLDDDLGFNDLNDLELADDLETELFATEANDANENTDLDGLLDFDLIDPSESENTDSWDELLGSEAADILDEEIEIVDSESASNRETPIDEFTELEKILDQDVEISSSLTVDFDELAELLEETSGSLKVDFGELEAFLDQKPSRYSEPLWFAELQEFLGEKTSQAGAASSATEKVSLINSESESIVQAKLALKERSAAAASSSRSGMIYETMRVPVKQLDNLGNLIGELVVSRNTLEQDQERMRQFLDNLLHQVQNLTDVGQRMQDLYERVLLEIALLSSRRQNHHFMPEGATQMSNSTEHDLSVFEMDKFTPFHTLAQEILELIVRVRESASDIEFLVDETDQVTRQLRQITNKLQEGINRSRMVPFAQTADRLPRGVRDNSIKFGKQVELMVEGSETLIDKMILENLNDPMTHLVNNALAHGIERPEDRQRKGKSPTGRITIRAFHQGNQTVISVSDDGAGIDAERVKAKALDKGLITSEQAKTLSRLEVYDLLFAAGFTTKDQADDLAGRGVGLDVVRTNLSAIRGVVNIDSNLGKGTSFTIRVPLAFSISKALICISDRARIAFPMDGVEDMLDVPRDKIQTTSEEDTFIPWRDTMLPFRPMRDLLVYHRNFGRGSVFGGNTDEDIISVVVLRSAGNYLALQVDQVIGEQEIVIKQLEGPVPKPIGIAGATVMGDGRIVAIADVLELIDLAAGRISEKSSLIWEEASNRLSEEAMIQEQTTVLIVDDSITVRELLSMTFNKAGYRVEQARDGQEAWEKLKSGLPCNIVFCDIEMPRMDGLELLSRLQKDAHFNDLPIAMLTSRGADRHRQMAVQLGAKGYFTKPYLEEALLDAAQRMLKGEVLVGAEG